MSVAVAAGYPQQSGILIPEVWSGKLLAKFYASTVLAAIANTDYEGEISKQGDTCWIRTVPDIEIHDYSKGQSLQVQHPEASKLALKIDKAKYWNAIVDNIDKFQSDLQFLEDWTRDASSQMKMTWDRAALGEIYVDAATANQGATAGLESGDIDLGVAGTPVAITKSNVVDFIVESAGTVLDEQNVPDEDRNIVIPSWMVARIKTSELKDASLTGDGKSTLRNGRVGMIDRFTIYGSNLLPKVKDGSSNCWHAIACQKSALTFASQLTENKVMDAESTFGTLVRGLQVCGWEVIKPEAMVDLYVSKG